MSIEVLEGKLGETRVFKSKCTFEKW